MAELPFQTALRFWGSLLYLAFGRCRHVTGKGQLCGRLAVAQDVELGTPLCRWHGRPRLTQATFERTGMPILVGLEFVRLVH